MNFPIKDLEFHIEDALIERAERLIALQAVRQFQEIERHLWVAMVKDEQTFEVEVQISPSKLKAFTCDCERSQASDICAHVVVILILLREKAKIKQKEVKEKKVTKTKVPNRITTSTILDLVRPNELKAFIKKYASQDRTFTLMLKAQFAHIVPGHEEKEHISKVLENAIKGVKRPGKPITTSGIKLVQRVVNTIHQQSEEAQYKKHYADVFESLTAIISQLVVLCGFVKDDTVLPKLLEQSYKSLHKLTKSNIAPQLENEIWEFLLNESQGPSYYLNDLWPDLLALMTQMSTTSPRQERFIEILDELEKERFSQRNTVVRSGVLNTKMSVLNLQGNQAALDLFLKYNMNDKAILLSAVKLSADKTDWKKVKQLATYGLDKNILESNDISLHEYLLEAAIQLREKKEVIKHALVCFREAYDFKYIDLIKSHAGKKWLKIRNQLIDDLKTEKFNIETRNCIAKLFADENLSLELLTYVESTLSLDLLKKYDEDLRISYSKKLPDIYKKLIYNYLNNYIGRQAAVKVRQSIEHLLAQDQTNLANSLVSEIRLNYKERHALLDELGRF